MMKHVAAGPLNIAYYEYGPGDGPVAILLHGFPYAPDCYAEVAAILAEQGVRSIVPYLRGYGETVFLEPGTPRSGEQAALGADVLALMDALEIPNAVLAGYDWGGRAACIVSALWPKRVNGLLSCGVGYNIQNIARANEPAPAAEEARYWYIYLFHTERGRQALEKDRAAFCRYIWTLWSPNWNFDDATYARSAAAFENPDFVDIVIHSYRHRFGGIPGDPAVAEIEAQLAAQPDITVPTIIMQGTDDTVDPPPEEDDARPHFTGPYERIILQGVGHNPPQEAPDAFAEAVFRLTR